ncbi:lysophospholipid acyltransferase family protein [Rasiella sp. SM2506]|uniref:lysophospholipid acyltransferase family protein n=1 Tax=Rasiella sp. SM2506 TaxID=3423914 RepID=UPI003D7A9905
MKILSYPFSVVFYLLFGGTIVLFHPIQWIAFNWFGYHAHKIAVDALQWFLMRCLNVLGTRFTVELPDNLPVNKPVIIASNHQSMWDIPPLIWFLRKLHVKFISKIELGKGIPSISYNLRKGGSVLIDRKNPEQATAQIEKIAQYISSTHRAVVIFPEGTRSRDGYPKPFKTKGLKLLFKNAPDAFILPVSISNSWKLQRFGMFPIPMGVHLKMKVHEPIKISEYQPDALISLVEQTVLKDIVHD